MASDSPRPPDPEVCVCFHVPLGKLAKYCRLEKPAVASQLSECYGAGTGCGWCIPFLEQIHEQVRHGEEPTLRMSGEEYRRRRLQYHQTGRRDLPEQRSVGQEPTNDSEGTKNHD